MTCCNDFPDHKCPAPSIECIEPDEKILFVSGMAFTHENEPRCASEWRSSDRIDQISFSEFGIADSACTAGAILMRPVSEAATAGH